MRVMVLGLCCGMLLTISAIASESPQDAWSNTLGHDGNGGVSLNELKAVRDESFYLIDINHDKVISPNKITGSKTWSQRFIRLDTDYNSLVNLAEFETMAETVFSLIDTNADSQITTHVALKFQHKTLKQAPSNKVSR
jgi:hypothetical protein